MSDLTVIFLTLNKLPEKWVKYHREILCQAIGDTSLITISRKPLDWGTNLIQEGDSYSNIYWQILRGTKVATTPYIAIAEDDTLYPKKHFEYRPPKNAFAYNMTRWGLFTWGPPTYFWKHRVTNATLIAPRQLTIEALEERFNKYPNGLPEGLVGELGRGKIEQRLGVTERRHIEFWTTDPVLCFNHGLGLDRLQINQRKRMWFVRAFDIPYWGQAEEMVKKFI